MSFDQRWYLVAVKGARSWSASTEPIFMIFLRWAEEQLSDQSDSGESLAVEVGHFSLATAGHGARYRPVDTD